MTVYIYSIPDISIDVTVQLRSQEDRDDAVTVTVYLLDENVTVVSRKRYSIFNQ